VNDCLSIEYKEEIHIFHEFMDLLISSIIIIIIIIIIIVYKMNWTRFTLKAHQFMNSSRINIDSSAFLNFCCKF
jgi:hypothetical protein